MGYVDGPNNIWHFIQVEGTSRLDKKWDVSNLPIANDKRKGTHLPEPTLDDKTKWPLISYGPRGGLFMGSTLKEFLEAPYIKATTYEVWRWSLDGMQSLVGKWKWSSPVAPHAEDFAITSQDPDGTFTGQTLGTHTTLTGHVVNDTVEFHGTAGGFGPVTFKATLEKGGQVMQGKIYFVDKTGASFSAWKIP